MSDSESRPILYEFVRATTPPTVTGPKTPTPLPIPFIKPVAEPRVFSDTLSCNIVKNNGGAV